MHAHLCSLIEERFWLLIHQQKSERMFAWDRAAVRDPS